MTQQLTVSQYIETVYGTSRFARTLVVDDAQSIMDLMQDFSDHNVKASESTTLLDDFAKAAMQGILSAQTEMRANGAWHTPTGAIQIAEEAYDIATAMMQERERRMKG